MSPLYDLTLFITGYIMLWNMKNKPYLHKDFIDSRALEIVEALQSKSFTTYLVGGCVRDLLLGIQPKDYDIGTMASPPQVKRSVYQSYIIGKRFRLVLAKSPARKSPDRKPVVVAANQ